MCLVANGRSTHNYLNKWSEGTERKFYKVLVKMDNDVLYSHFYPVAYKIGENVACLKGSNIMVPAWVVPDKEILDVTSAIHVCVVGQSLDYWLREIREAFSLPQAVVVEVTAKREDLIGCNITQEDFAFRKVTISETEYRKHTGVPNS